MSSNIETNKWIQQPQVNTPEPRYKHCALIFEGSMFIFGGRSKLPHKQNFNDIHEYNFKSKEWRSVIALNPHIAPSPRAGHTAVKCKDKMVVFGGHDGELKNDLYYYNFRKNEWAVVQKDASNSPSSRVYHSAVVLDDHFMLIYGGFDNRGQNEERSGTCCDDLYKYDIITEEWEFVRTSGEVPHRYNHSAVLYLNSMYVFGGRDKFFRRCRDLYELNLVTNIWRKIVGSGQLPTHRTCHLSFVYQNNLYIFGGSTNTIHEEERNLNDLYKFDLITNHWEEVICNGNVPSGRMFASCVVDDDCAYLFGGFDGTNFLNDLYKLQLNHCGLFNIKKLKNVEKLYDVHFKYE